MSKPLPETVYEILKQAKEALKKGDLHTARSLALKAVKLAPEHEEPWLYLASVSSPKASISYLKKALAINPESKQAQKGMHWAIQRFRKTYRSKKPKKPRLPVYIADKPLTIHTPSLLSWSTAILILVAVIVACLWAPEFSFALQNMQSSPQITLAAGEYVRKVTYTPTPTNTPTLTPTPTNTPTPTITVVIAELVPTATPNLTSEQEQIGTITVLIFVGLVVILIVFSVRWMIRGRRAG